MRKNESFRLPNRYFLKIYLFLTLILVSYFYYKLKRYTGLLKKMMSFFINLTYGKVTLKKSILKALCYSITSLVTHSTLLSLAVLICPLVVLVYSLVLLAHPPIVLVRPFVWPLVALLVLSLFYIWSFYYYHCLISDIKKLKAKKRVVLLLFTIPNNNFEKIISIFIQKTLLTRLLSPMSRQL